MASTAIVYNESVSGLIATQDLPKKSLSPRDRDFVCVINVTNRVDGTFTGKIQHSYNGTNWFDLTSFAAKSANGSEAVHINSSTTHVMTYVKAVITVAGATSGADVEVLIMSNQFGG